MRALRRWTWSMTSFEIQDVKSVYDGAWTLLDVNAQEDQNVARNIDIRGVKIASSEYLRIHILRGKLGVRELGWRLVGIIRLPRPYRLPPALARPITIQPYRAQVSLAASINPSA
jgi:hypothetical protein